MRRLISTCAPVVGSLLVLLSAMSCGKASDGDGDGASATPTPTPTSTEVAETSPVAFWLSGNSAAGPLAVRFDSAGRQSLVIDLVSSGIDFGPITAFHFMDVSTLLFFVNPGTDKETMGTLDIKTGLVKNKAWGSESSIKAIFKNAPAKSMFTGFQPSVLHAQTETGIKSIRYNADGGLSAENFYDSSTAANCPLDKLTGIFLVQGGGASQIIALSAGTQTRLNVLSLAAGAVSCKSSFDYASGLTTSAHRAVNLVQMTDGKIYVLYQHDVESGSDPKIIRYDFDGTNLTNGVEIFKGVNNLGKKPFGMIARTNKRLLVARPDVYALIEIAIKGNSGEQTDYYQKSAYVKDLSALIAEPQQ